MTTKEYKQIVAIKEKIAQQEAELSYKELENSYLMLFENIISGIAYKHNIPKEQYKDFEKFCYNKVINFEENINPTNLQDILLLIGLCEDYVKEFNYTNEFQEIIDHE